MNQDGGLERYLSGQKPLDLSQKKSGLINENH
jgi:hypothetical protein